MQFLLEWVAERADKKMSANEVVTYTECSHQLAVELLTQIIITVEFCGSDYQLFL